MAPVSVCLVSVPCSVYQTVLVGASEGSFTLDALESGVDKALASLGIGEVGSMSA